MTSIGSIHASVYDTPIRNSPSRSGAIPVLQSSPEEKSIDRVNSPITWTIPPDAKKITDQNITSRLLTKEKMAEQDLLFLSGHNTFDDMHQQSIASLSEFLKNGSGAVFRSNQGMLQRSLQAQYLQLSEVTAERDAFIKDYNGRYGTDISV